MDSPAFRELAVNGIRMRVAEQGAGPLVLLCHGWPESWYSWRAQMVALAKAGYHAVAPDMRGYGGTEAPSDVAGYTQLHLVGDVVELVHALGEREAVVVGHDWGAAVAWNAAMMRPDLFRAVAGMSVPFAPPGRSDPLAALEKRGIRNFYIQYFQAPGVAEAELERDVAASLRRIYYSGSGDRAERAGGPTFGLVDPALGLLANTSNPAELPPWLAAADIEYYAAEFRRTGFRGGLNWYRNLSKSWELLAPWRGCAIRQPSLFIAGERDDVLKFPGSPGQIERFAETLPGLRGCHILPAAGHWIQQERAAAVNGLLVDFLQRLRAS